jgi:hypothetical protein
MKALKGGHDPVRKEHAYSHTAALLQRLVGEQVADQMRWFFFYHDSLITSGSDATLHLAQEKCNSALFSALRVMQWCGEACGAHWFLSEDAVSPGCCSQQSRHPIADKV